MQQLRDNCPQGQLAAWIRDTCLGKKARKSKVAMIDPRLLRQLAAVGNNVNQIARAVNRQDIHPIDKTSLTIQPQQVEASLHHIKENHPCTSNFYPMERAVQWLR